MTREVVGGVSGRRAVNSEFESTFYDFEAYLFHHNLLPAQHMCVFVCVYSYVEISLSHIFMLL